MLSNLAFLEMNRTYQKVRDNYLEEEMPGTMNEILAATSRFVARINV